MLAMTIESGLVIAVGALVAAVVCLFGLVVAGYRECKKERREFLTRLLAVEEKSCTVKSCSLRRPITSGSPSGSPVTV